MQNIEYNVFQTDKNDMESIITGWDIPNSLYAKEGYLICG